MAKKWPLQVQYDWELLLSIAAQSADATFIFPEYIQGECPQLHPLLLSCCWKIYLDVRYHIVHGRLRNNIEMMNLFADGLVTAVVLVVVVFTLKAVPISTQYFLTSVLVQLTRTPSVVTG